MLKHMKLKYQRILKRLLRKFERIRALNAPVEVKLQEKILCQLATSGSENQLAT